jgi:DUF971 family protein
LTIIKPTGIDVHQKNHQMVITWDDGHTSTYSFSLLRHACPCAECRGGHDNMSSDPDPLVYDLPEEDSPRTMLISVEAVGSYAISLNWEDGHHYGIYNWDYLRTLCPCPSCRGI